MRRPRARSSRPPPQRSPPPPRRTSSRSSPTATTRSTKRPTERLSNGAGEHVFSGRNAGFVGPTNLRRALVRFDVGAIPAGATITSVTLTVTQSTFAAGECDVALHTVLADWGEGASDTIGQEGAGTAATPGDATWLHTFFAGSSWTSPGGDFDPAPSAVQRVDLEAPYVWGSTPAMVADVQCWVGAPGSNFGWLVKHADEGPSTTAKRFASREHQDPSSRPTLEVEFLPPGGCDAASYCAVNPSSTGSPRRRPSARTRGRTRTSRRSARGPARRSSRRRRWSRGSR